MLIVDDGELLKLMAYFLYWIIMELSVCLSLGSDFTRLYL